MRSTSFAAVAVAFLASASGASAAGLPELDVHTLASAKPIPTSVTDDKQVPTTNPLAVVHGAAQDLYIGSSANASATATFGTLKAYSDALKANDNIAEAQSDAESTFIDDFNGSTFLNNATYYASFNINGTTSAQPQFGPGPSVQVTWRLDDLTARTTILLGAWHLGNPVTSFSIPFQVPVGDETRWYVDLSTFTYDGAQSVPGLVFANFGHTVLNHIDPAGGASAVVGASGHDYATPAAVPEPATWAMLLLGVGAVGGAARRRRQPRRAPTGWLEDSPPSTTIA